MIHTTSKSQHICRILNYFPPPSFCNYSTCLDTGTGVLTGLRGYLASSGSRVPKLSPVSHVEFQQFQQASLACKVCLEPLKTIIPYRNGAKHGDFPLSKQQKHPMTIKC